MKLRTTFKPGPIRHSEQRLYNGDKSHEPQHWLIIAILLISFNLVGLVFAASFPVSLELSELDGNNGLAFNGADEMDISGFSVSGVGDLNGDGIDDIIIGAPQVYWDDWEPICGTGRNHVVFGSDQGFPPDIDLDSLDGTNGFSIDGITVSDQTGYSVSNAGDVNRDGIDDLVIGAPGTNCHTGIISGNRSYVVFGANQGFPEHLSLTSLNGSNEFIISGEAYTSTGYSVSSAGDVNADGIDDLIIGAPYADWSTGKSYVVFGSDEGFPSALELNSLDDTQGFVLIGDSGDWAGYSVSSAGDINADGIDDLIIGAPQQSGVAGRIGKSYVVFGTTQGFTSPLELTSLDGEKGFVLTGVDPTSDADIDLGYSVASAGDVNGDGIDDLIVGDPNFFDSDMEIWGKSYVVFGTDQGFPATFELATLDGTQGFVLNGEGRTGHSVSSAGDVNGDGIHDLIIGAPRADVEERDAAGRSYVVFGSIDGIPSPLELASLDGDNGFVLNGIDGGSAALDGLGDNAGHSVSSAGDVNGDGVGDLIVGAPYADPNGNASGQSYVIFGRLGDAALNVSIDILPNRFPNLVRPGVGFIPVAVLTNSEFDITQVDPAAVRFGPAEASAVKHSLDDVDDDGDLDLLLDFRSADTGITCGDTEATLTGTTFDGQAISGSDTIKTVGCRKTRDSKVPTPGSIASENSR